MAKTIQYPKGAVIFFEGEISSNIYILQSGSVEISSVDPGTNKTVVSYIKAGEFFGVKNPLIHMPHMSQATTKSDSVVLAISVMEFEFLLDQDSKLRLNMISAICSQLTDLHAKLYSKFNSKRESTSEHGIFQVAKGFYNSDAFMHCLDVCDTFLNLFPESKFKDKIDEMLEASQREVANIPEIDKSIILADTSDMEVLVPDAFDRLEKTFPIHQTIFSEYEKNDSIFLILSGIVRSAKYIRGRNLSISITTPGEFFGLNGLIGQELRDVTSIATSQVKALEIPLKDFDSIVLASPKIAYMILKLLAKRVHDDRLMLRNVYIQDLQIRLKDMFVVLNDIGLCQPLRGLSRKIFLSATDISLWTSFPVEVIEEELEVLEKQGAITLPEDGRYIIVKNIEEARRVAKGQRLVIS